MPTATIEGHTSRMGKSQAATRCTCGILNLFFLWSWAGHGKAKCKGCGSFISYRSLEVTPAPQKNKGR